MIKMVIKEGNMELILISVLTILAMCLGFYFGKSIGAELGASKGYDYGYEDGITDATNTYKEESDFPKTLDGMFFSTEAAIRNMSKPGGDK